MVGIVTIDESSENSCEAEGHPSECTPVVDGQIIKQSNHNVTLTDASGVTKQLATINSARLSFSSHSHTFDAVLGACVDDKSHVLSADSSAFDDSLKVNGSRVFIVEDDVTTDPDSGGAVNVLSQGASSITFSQK